MTSKTETHDDLRAWLHAEGVKFDAAMARAREGAGVGPDVGEPVQFIGSTYTGPALFLGGRVITPNGTVIEPRGT